jgi:hypothetical protein
VFDTTIYNKYMSENLKISISREKGATITHGQETVVSIELSQTVQDLINAIKDFSVTNSLSVVNLLIGDNDEGQVTDENSLVHRENGEFPYFERGSNSFGLSETQPISVLSALLILPLVAKGIEYLTFNFPSDAA